MPETQAGRNGERSAPPADILARIVETKREEIAALRPRAAEVRSRARDAAPPLDAREALRRPGEVALIAEVKRRSPGAGDIRPGLDPVDLARGYGEAGAAALSVLTDGPWFGGGLDDLEAVREAVGIPLLRKDFVLDPLQVSEARAAGADLVLLIVRILEQAALEDLLGEARSLGMAALVEVHGGDELERALAAGADLIGVNNRDLGTFRTDLAVTLGLLDAVPADAVLVSESGIRSAGDVERLGAHGVDAVLVGESLLRAPDPSAAAAALVRRPRVARG